MAIGFPPCPGGIMASNPAWCRPLGGWLESFGRWLDHPSPPEVLAASIHFDLRPIAGAVGQAASCVPSSRARRPPAGSSWPCWRMTSSRDRRLSPSSDASPRGADVSTSRGRRPCPSRPRPASMRSSLRSRRSTRSIGSGRPERTASIPPRRRPRLAMPISMCSVSGSFTSSLRWTGAGPGQPHRSSNALSGRCAVAARCLPHRQQSAGGPARALSDRPAGLSVRWFSALWQHPRLRADHVA